MRLWRQPAQLLPVQVRPVSGETVVSYVFRLADANAVSRPTLLLRTLGEPVAANIHAGMLDHHDITLNPLALARLAVLTGRSVARLRKTLPSLDSPRADGRLFSKTEPLISSFSSSDIRGHCQRCISRIPGHPGIRVHRRSAPAICRRHKRWVDTSRYQPNQLDLSRNIEIITAHRRFDRLLTTIADSAWAREQLRRTTAIVTEWHHHRDPRSISHFRFEHLHARWDKRAETLPSPGSLTSLLAMPEAVALAEILCDLEWRRHVAMADEFDLNQFYRLVARRLGQSPKFATGLAYSFQPDPLKRWVLDYRKRFRTTRDEHWKRVRTHHPYNRQFPEAILPTIRHFK